MISALPLLISLLMPGCAQEPGKASFHENVGEAFAQCNPAEIRFLAGKHNFMTAFENCGSNHFRKYAWSPRGTHLYFQLTMTHHIMNAEADNKRTITVPTESPTGGAGWLNAHRIAIPIGREMGDPDKPERIIVYDMEQNSNHTQPVPGVSLIDDIQVGDNPSDVLFTAIGPDDKRHAYRLDLDLGTVSKAYPWLTTPAETLRYTKSANAVAIGHDNTVTLYSTIDGAELGAWSPAVRGALHPDGRWMMLEYNGQAISVFYQRHWDELSENARKRELARAKRFEEQLPHWYPKEVNPPMLSAVDLTTGNRWAFTAFMGHNFQWYRAQPYYSSFVLWGFEGKEYNRNIVLGNLADRFNSIARDEEMLGVERWDFPQSTGRVSDRAKAGLVEPEAPPKVAPETDEGAIVRQASE